MLKFLVIVALASYTFQSGELNLDNTTPILQNSKDHNESIISTKTLAQIESYIITESSTIAEPSKIPGMFLKNYKQPDLDNKNDELISLVVEQINYVLNNLERIHVGNENLLKYLTTNNQEEFCHLMQPICCTHNETISSLRDYSWITEFTTRPNQNKQWRPDRPDGPDSTQFPTQPPRTTSITTIATKQTTKPTSKPTTKPTTTTEQTTTIKSTQSKSSTIEFQKSLLVFPILLVNICQILFWS
ncbi:G8 domain-containing protein DDB_G0286311-like [Phlebotomus papatasi]|uniref:G8 domain-containing protein DDB_G0286311-like n=1 Tax=Phlebotomus papatasi TaxID=29031 RepID=UPI0024842DA4|nr:G8 domain-containing protein DDB_G0286311-like [Phlebotomus papatasi]